MMKCPRAAYLTALTVLLISVLLPGPLTAGAGQASELPGSMLPFSLYFSAEDLPGLRQSILDGPQQRMWQLLRDDCDEFISGPGYGDLETLLVEGSSIYSYLELGLRMKELSLAYLLSGNQRYADRCIALMLETSDVSRWLARAHARQTAEFETGALLQAMVTSLDWLNHCLTDEERQRIVRAIVKKGAEPAAEFVADCVDDRPSSYARFIRTNNHFAVLCSGFGTAAIALREIDPRAGRWLDLSVRGVEQFIGTYGYGEDGSYREGALYWSFTTSALLRFIDPLKRLTGHDLFQHPRLQKTLEFRLLLQSPSFSPHAAVNFGDSEYARGLPAMTILRLASEYGDRSAMWFYERIFDRKPALVDPFSDDVVFAILWYDQAVTAQPPSYPLKAHFPDIDWVVLRSGWQKDATLFAFKSGGWLYSHDHPDRNSFLMEAHGERLAVDSGCGNYSWPEFAQWQRRTVGHNTLLIDGSGQHRISQGGRPAKLNAEILTFQPGGPYTYFCSDAAGAYPSDLEKNLRHVLLMESGYAVIIDELKKKEKPSTFTWLFHTDNRDGKTVINRPADDEIIVHRPKAGLLIKVVAPGEFDCSTGTGTLGRHRGGSLTLDVHDGKGQTAASNPSSEERAPVVKYPRRMETEFFTLLFPFPRDQKLPRFETVALDAGHAVRITGDNWCDTIGYRAAEGGPANLAGTVSDAVIAATRTVDGQLSWMGFQDVTQVTHEGRTVLTSDTRVSIKLVLRPDGRTCHIHADHPAHLAIENHTGTLQPCAVPAGTSVVSCEGGEWRGTTGS